MIENFYYLDLASCVLGCVGFKSFQETYMNMAAMDSRDFLIRNLTNSFITSDETGICELLFDANDCLGEDALTENVKGRRSCWHNNVGSVKFSSNAELKTSSDKPESLEIQMDMHQSMIRPRSKTADRLESLKRDRINRSQVKNMKWRPNAQAFKSEDFEGKNIRVDKNFSSVLSSQLQSLQQQSTNPFSEFAKFNGLANEGIPNKQVEIFLNILQGKKHKQKNMMQVNCITSARIKELIGLICWQYSNEARAPPLVYGHDYYALHIVEDDGQVDADFPALDPKEKFSKFEFDSLALVERKRPTEEEIVVKIYMVENKQAFIPVDGPSVIMKDILDLCVEKHCSKRFQHFSYYLTKFCDIETPIDLETTLEEQKAFEFVLVREFSKPPISVMSRTYQSATSMKLYHVVKPHKLRNTVIELTIGESMIYVYPMASSKFFRPNKFFQSDKPYTIETSKVLKCRMMEKSSDVALLRIDYRKHQEKAFAEFEAKVENAQAIVEHVNSLISTDFDSLCLT